MVEKGEGKTGDKGKQIGESCKRIRLFTLTVHASNPEAPFR